MATETVGHDPLIGRTLSHYRILEKIGAGGMGEVYRAVDERLDRDVAIKVLPQGTLADEAARRRFHREAIALSRINHPNVATIHEFGTEHSLDFLVMEYIPGETLSEKLQAASLAPKEVVRLGTQLVEGLIAAHEHSVIHRDLKPGNLRLSPEGRLKVLDFGLAKFRLATSVELSAETLRLEHSLIGTLPYMAPEQVLGGEIDARTDIHATGAVLYEMLTGERAFNRSGREDLFAAILRSEPRPPQRD